MHEPLLVHNQLKVPSRVAAVVTLWSDSYSQGVLTLSFSLRQHSPSIPLILLYFDDRVSNDSLQTLAPLISAFVPVNRIEPPTPPTTPHFRDNFARLAIFRMTEFQRILFLDGDCLVVNDVSCLLHIPKELGLCAVTDVADGLYRPTFNAGVMTVVPSLQVFRDLMVHMVDSTFYDTQMAEQGLLNSFFGRNHTRLPTSFNLNLALWHMPEDLAFYRQDEKIIHYTLHKPWAGASEFYGTVLQIWRDTLKQANIYVGDQQTAEQLK